MTLELASLASAAVILAACSRTPSPTPTPAPAPAPPPGPLAAYLPAAAGPFAGGPLESGPGYLRRTYSRGATRIGVTIADAGAAPVRYGEWLRMSEGYPPVTLDVPPGAAAGFYDCSGAGTAELCHAHFQARSGYHVEVMGPASRADLDIIIAAIPFRAMSERSD